MNGRQENSAKIDRDTLRAIESAPKIVKDYYYSFTNKTSSTKRAYTLYVMHFVNYISELIDVDDPCEFSKVKVSDINRYMEYIRCREVNGVVVENSESIRATKLFAVSNFFEFLMNDEYVTSNPCKRVEAPKLTTEKDVVAMTADEIDIMKNNIKHGVHGKSANVYASRDYAIVSLGCSTGLRVRSITEINISDMNLDENKIVVREKGNKEREVYIGEKTKCALIEYLKDREEMYPDIDTDALFISKKRNRLSTNAVRGMIAKYSEGIDKHITPHKMRSSCATNLYENTKDIYLVQSVLGHKNIANTRRYAMVSSEGRKAAANILDDMF